MLILLPFPISTKNLKAIDNDNFHVNILAMSLDTEIERALQFVTKVFPLDSLSERYSYGYNTPNDPQWRTAEPGTQVTARARRMRYVLSLVEARMGIDKMEEGLYNAKSPTALAFLTVIVRRELLRRANRRRKYPTIDNEGKPHRQRETIAEEMARKTPKAPPITPLASRIASAMPHLSPSQLLDIARFTLDVG